MITKKNFSHPFASNSKLAQKLTLFWKKNDNTKALTGQNPMQI
jgi:hypothetical protein